MSRGLLDDAQLTAIERKVPAFKDVADLILSLNPYVMSMAFHPLSTVPCAAPCFLDMKDAMEETRYALHEAMAHRVYYIDVVQPKNEITAVFFTRYYADDAALRLYSAGERLAEAIVEMLEIGDVKLAPYAEKRVSRQSIVGNYLREREPASPITQAVRTLWESNDWRRTMAYRNEWVHDQPPLIKGLGVVFRRGKRWTPSQTKNRFEMVYGQGDEPKLSAEELLEFTHGALSAFVITARAVLQHYAKMLPAT